MVEVQDQGEFGGCMGGHVMCVRRADDEGFWRCEIIELSSFSIDSWGNGCVILTGGLAMNLGE